MPNLLREALRRLLQPKPDGLVPRVAFVGIGSELRGDDAVGVVIVNRFQGRDNAAHRPRQENRALPPGAPYLFTNGGSAPENVLGEVKAFQPEILIFIDAAILGNGESVPGSVRLIDTSREKISGVSFCTHSLPLTIIADYIRQSIPCAIFVIGIEPGDMSFRPDCALTPPVAAAAEAVVEAIASSLRMSAGELG